MHTRLRIFASVVLFVSLLTESMPVQADAPKCYTRGLNGAVCLTIDDGFGREHIKRILDVLREKKVNCTFFVTGDALRLNVDLWKQAVEDGNEIGYHTMHHKHVTDMTNSQVQRDLNNWNMALKKALPDYRGPKLARFPGGRGGNSKRLLNLFAKNGYKVIGWSVDMHISLGRNPSLAVANHIKKLTKPGSIILIHFSYLHANALPCYIDWLKSNFKLCKVTDALADQPAVVPSPKPFIHYARFRMD